MNEQGEVEHRRSKGWFDRVSPNNPTPQIIKVGGLDTFHREKAAELELEAAQSSGPIAPHTRPDDDALPYSTPADHIFIAKKSSERGIRPLDLVNNHKGDPAFTVCALSLRLDHTS